MSSLNIEPRLISEVINDFKNAVKDGRMEDLDKIISEQGKQCISDLDQNYEIFGPNSSPIVTAASNGHLEIVRILLEHGAKKGIDNALETAASKDHQELVLLLLKHGANVDNALEAAVANEHHEILTILFQHRKVPTHTVDPILLRAALKGQHETVRILIQHGSIESISKALVGAAKNGHHETVQCLLQETEKCGYRYLLQNAFDDALINAATNGHHEVVHTLLMQETTRSRITIYGNIRTTALHSAGTNGHHETVRLLLNHSSANIFDDLKTALHMGHLNIVVVIYDSLDESKKKEIAKLGRKTNGVSAAIARGHPDLLAFLLLNGAKTGGDKALRHARSVKSKDCRVLLEDEPHLGDVIEVLNRAFQKNFVHVVKLIAKKENLTFEGITQT